jgi:hypothetical protein
LRTGEDGDSSHQQRIADAIVFINGDGDDRARFEAARGAADADAALLAQAIEGAIKRRICQPPKASWASQAMAATVINAVTIKSP